jgi:hypothetical protein
MAGWSEVEKSLLAGELLDPTKVHLICGEHKYIASKTPPFPNGCINCWKAYWWFQVATSPPHLREQLLDLAYKAVYDSVKAHERGEFDFTPFTHPEVTIERDALDDDTNVYTPSTRAADKKLNN